MNHMVEIIVKDKNMMGPNEFLGRAEVPMSRFARPGGIEEFIELWNMGYPSGNVLFKADYQVQAVAGQPGTTTTTTIIVQQPNPYAAQGYGYQYPPPRGG